MPLLFLLHCKVMAMPAQILLIRHAEKPDIGNELSARGWERAKLLPQMFNTRAELTEFGQIASLFAMAPAKQDGSVRAIQTLKFVAENLKVGINSDFKRDQVSELIDSIKNDRNLDGKTVLICWEHSVLIDIAHELGVQSALTWPGHQFDRVWSLTFSTDSKLTRFESLPEKLLPGDSAN